MHSLPGKLHSLVYLRVFRAVTKREAIWYARKNEKDKQILQSEGGQVRIYVVQRLFRGFFSATFQVPHYRAPHTLLAGFTRHVLSPLCSRLRFLCFYIYDRYECPSRPSSRQLHDVLLHRDIGINGLHPGLRNLSSLSFFRFTRIPLCCL